MSDPQNDMTYWQSLAVAADEGHLFLNPEAAAACSSACDIYIDQLKLHQDSAKLLANVSGWGDFASGQQLQKIFSEKAVGGDNNMVDVLQSHIDVVEEMKVVFSKFFSATQAIDEANAAGVQAQGPK
ncbi:MAG: hypothetical protein WBD41_05600 [Rhodococcus sp. (in: high G+C Gram-positive bacteria)]|jgi:hypothetical protein|uniref:hypothetical protein n=1 Tax=Rhodococcus sp. EPR-157 TaxID=1813677 RepID=UPI0007BB0C7B|nr:hypothetical protein [Rhodococcus sp. EPR-157]KZF07322.1 hypothetical protein A2J03_23010 [Rhodococcus sp. EPR-157]